MTAYPKRLIEVDLPIKRISAHARREKSIRHGGIPRRCISGGRGGLLWQRVVRSFAHRSGPTRPTRFAPRVFEMPPRN